MFPTKPLAALRWLGAAALSSLLSVSALAQTVTVSRGGPIVNTSFASQTGTFTVTYDATPSASPSNSLVMLSKGTQTAYIGFACLVRFNPTGKIDARNGGAYPASTISYVAGSTYHFRIAVNVPAHSYSVYVTPPSGSELTVAPNYAFRAEQNTVTSLSSWGAVVETDFAGTLTVTNFAVAGMSQVATPVFNPPAGSYSSAQTVTITTATSGASIRYTTDNNTPSQTAGTLYAGPVAISSTKTLKAIAYATGMANSSVNSGTYTISTGSLDPNAPPGTNFDLRNWKITLPYYPDEPDVLAPDLVAGFQKANEFYTDPVTGGMVFQCPNLAGTTSGTSYSRSELREMMIPMATSGATSPANNWVLSTSTLSDQRQSGGIDGTLNATLTVDKVSISGDAAKVGRIIVGQIHGNSSEVIRLMYHKRPQDALGAVYFGHDNPSNVNTYFPIIGDPNNLNPANGILLGQVWSYEIKVVAQTLTVKVTPQGGSTYTATLQLEDGYRGDKLYFKAGNYHLNNTGDASDYAQSTFYSLTHTHNPPPP